jgi:hypothetical protein
MASKKGKHQNTTNMNVKTTHDAFNTSPSLAAHLINLPPPPRYETAGARATRMIIDSASYTTTPGSSPPSEPASHVFSAHDAHGKVPDIAALAEADRMLEHQMDQGGRGQLPVLQVTDDTDCAPSDRTRSRQGQGIIPPYMLHAVAASEAAEPRVRASTEQTLSSLKPATHNHQLKVEEFAPTVAAPAQRQLEDGRWMIGT